MLFNVGGEPRDLLVLVFRRNRTENRLVEAAADQFGLAAFDEFSQPREILGPILFNPREQRPGIVQPKMDAGMFFELLEKRKIRIPIRLL